MRKWWSNNEELTPEEQRLFAALLQAHAACVYRENCSTAALQQAAFGSRKLPSAFIAALATLGDVHGPVEEAYDHFEIWDKLKSFSGGYQGGIVPGWGNSFIKGRIDDAFLPVDQILEAQFPRTHSRLREITDALHTRGKKVFPNPAAYTAAVAIILGMPKNLAPLLFVMGRTEAWGHIFHLTVNQKPEEKKEAA